MRVPVTSPQNNHSPSPKPSNNSSSNNNSIARNISFHGLNGVQTSCYEPTSVLDLRRSPSPVPEKPVTNSADVSNCISSDPHHHQAPALEWDEHVLRTMDWDSIMKDLGLDDESVPAIKTINPQAISPCENQIQSLPEFSSCELTHQSVHSDFNNLYDFYSEELIRAADCFDTNELQLAHVILARLNQRLRSPSGKPLQRAAFYFKEALQSLLTGSTRSTRLSSWSEIVQTIKAYKAFSGINPIPMFNHFTTNQALLEALDGSAPLIHIIDFDIGLGGQYASLMREMAERNDHSCKFIRITAVVPEEYAIETRLIKDNLFQFAQDLKIRFQIEFVLLRTFEMLSLKAFKFIDGEKTAILLSPSIFRCLSLNVAAFLSDLRRVNPSVVVFVDSEVWMESGTTSFRKNFVNGLEFYAMMFESLDAAVVGGEWVRKIETLLLRPRILVAVEAAARRTAPPWRELFVGAGMRAVHLSQFADFQAECLLGKVQNPAMAFLGSNVASGVGLRLLLCPLGSNIVTRAACCSVGIVLPVYSTFRAIERNDENEQQKWLTYWAAYGSFTIVEVFSDKLLSWFPYYYHFKFVFLVWLQLPSTEGAKRIYKNHLRPFLLRHQAKVDELMGFACAEMARFVSTHQEEFRFVRIMFRKMTGSADTKVTGPAEPDKPRGLPEIEGQTRMISNPESDHNE
ncbi:scarecrow-like protein 15 [Herrania umbratica]|uniref:Scarecrow-like protein 15 n=1 Tax=Herrania umbratica TaxID=108875 RepID=A0A6J1BP00_9ROSI|nr:scarecrow-like protein 15 [Herrania umbratica]